jgi:hypothetical protein
MPEMKLAALPITMESLSGDGLTHYVFLICEQSEAMKTANEDEVAKPSAIFPLSVLAVYTARMFRAPLGAGSCMPVFAIGSTESCAELSFVRRRAVAEELKDYLDWLTNRKNFEFPSCPFEMMGKFIYLKS